MNKIIKIISEYKEVAVVALAVMAFFFLIPMADPWTAGAGKDWIFRIPIAIAFMFSVPALTHFVYKSIFTTPVEDTPENNYQKRVIYSVITLGILIFLSALL